MIHFSTYQQSKIFLNDKTTEKNNCSVVVANLHCFTLK